MKTLTEETKSKFQTLLTALRLAGIETLQIHMDRGVSIEPVKDSKEKEVKISWNQSFRKDDPLISESNRILFRPKYDLLVALDEQVLYKHRTMFAILFEIKVRTDFDDCWASEEVRQAFQEKQITRTLWPFLRQQVADGMTRLGMPSVVLPWIV